MLSVIIPSYKDPLIKNTIEDILKNAVGEIEIIAVLDGYWIKPEYVVDDKRVNYLHLGKNSGMREAINAGVRISKGEYIMRSDEHCMYAPGFDKAILDLIQLNHIVTATRYFLDPIKWKRMDLSPVIYEKLKIRDIGNGTKKFEGQRWQSRDEKRKDIMYDETMAMQGSFWIMPKKWWQDVIGELQTEGYGTMYQDSHEMVFKTWQAGGKLMVNKNTWYAHKHVSFPRTHQYSRSKWEPCVKYAHNKWKDYYEKIIKPKWKI